MPWQGASASPSASSRIGRETAGFGGSGEVWRQVVMSAARRYLSSLWRDVAAQLAVRAPQRPMQSASTRRLLMVTRAAGSWSGRRWGWQGVLPGASLTLPL